MSRLKSLLIITVILISGSRGSASQSTPRMQPKEFGHNEAVTSSTTAPDVNLETSEVACTVKVPGQICEDAKREFGYWIDELDHKVPVVIADPVAFQNEKTTIISADIHSLAPRYGYIYTSEIMTELAVGKPCPIKVVISTDQFVPRMNLGFKLIKGMNPDEVFRIATYVGGFLKGCESSLNK